MIEKVIKMLPRASFILIHSFLFNPFKMFRANKIFAGFWASRPQYDASIILYNTPSC